MPPQAAPLLPAAEALRRLLEDVPAASRKAGSYPLAAALKRVLLRDAHAEVDVPPWDNSAMDGYALRAADAHRQLPIAGTVAAGGVTVALPAGEAAEIFTGAPLPEGADTVIPRECCRIQGGLLQCREKPHPGDHIRRRGQDIRAGALVVRAGQRLGAVELGLLASIGRERVRCRQPLRLALFSTGDELQEPGAPPAAGRIYNSNRYLLEGLLREDGWRVPESGLLPDHLETTEEALRQAARGVDCIVSTGGVSVGGRDYVRAALERCGELRLWRIAIKPGKPLAYGRVGEVPFFGLPGNPAAVFTAYNVFLRPYLRALEGEHPLHAPLLLPVTADFTRHNKGVRLHCLHVQVRNAPGGELRAAPAEEQSSGVLSSIAWANAFVLLPPDARVRPGDRLQALLYREVPGAPGERLAFPS